MKKIYCSHTVFILIASCLLVVSCTTQQKSKIGFLLPNSTSDRYAKEKIYFSEKLTQLGGEMVSVSADNDDKLQIQQAEELMNQGIKVLVVNSVNQNTSAAIVRSAHNHGVNVIAYDRLIQNCDLDYYLSFDNNKVGRLMAEYVTRVKSSGNYMLLCGDKSDLNASLVKAGQMEVLKPLISSGQIKLVLDVFVEDWSGPNASHELQQYINLTGQTPDVILSSYDGMSTDIIETLKTNNLAGHIMITGQDAELAACKNIIKDYQSMTVYKSLKKLAGEAAELSMKLIKNENVTDVTGKVSNGFKDVPAILLDPVAVDKNNMKSTVIADGLLKEADIYN